MGSSFGWEIFLLSSIIGAVIVAVLYDFSPSFRYKFKFAVFVFGYNVVAVSFMPLCLLRPTDVRNVLMAVPFVRPLSKICGINWKISGKEILKKDFPCVVICNHQSMLDVAAIIELWPSMQKCACIAKKELLYVFPFGLMAWLCGTIYINRRNPGHSQMTLSTSAEKIQQNKTKLWIFPEGTRNKNGEIMPFKKGAFHIAMTHKLPIVPVIISPYHFIDDKKFTFDSGTVKIKVLEPIDTSCYQYPEDISKLVDNCHDLMNHEFQKMKEELQLAPENRNPSTETDTIHQNGSASNGNASNKLYSKGHMLPAATDYDQLSKSTSL